MFNASELKIKNLGICMLILKLHVSYFFAL